MAILGAQEDIRKFVDLSMTKVESAPRNKAKRGEGRGPMAVGWDVTRRNVVLGGVAASLSAPRLAAAKPATRIVFSLDFIPLGRHAPWYAALGAGYFREEGLDVTIVPAQGTAQALQAIDSGVVQLGLGDVPGLVLARAAGSRMRVVTVNYQKSPYAIFSLANGAAVTHAHQLEGLHLGSGAGSFTPKMIAGFMTEKGLDPHKLHIVNIAPPARAGMLLSGRIPAIEFFVMSQPGLQAGAKAAHTSLDTFLLADHGLDLYSLGITGKDEFLAKNKQTVKGFVRAALRGWKLALSNPKQAAAYQMKFIPTLKEASIVAEIGVVRHLAVTNDTRRHGLGWFDPAKMASNVDFVVKYIGVSGKAPKPADIYEEGFLPSPPILP